LPDGYAEK
jgi:hypothetical protein